jgi:hypothetical protein
LDPFSGWCFESVAYHVGEGTLYKGRPRAQPFGSLCDVGDKIGCGIRPAASSSAAAADQVPI